MGKAMALPILGAHCQLPSSSCSWLFIPKQFAQVAPLQGMSPKPHALGCPGAEAHGAGLAGLSGCHLSISSGRGCLEEGISTGGILQVSSLPGLS